MSPGNSLIKIGKKVCTKVGSCDTAKYLEARPFNTNFITKFQIDSIMSNIQIEKSIACEEKQHAIRRLDN